LVERLPAGSAENCYVHTDAILSVVEPLRCHADCSGFMTSLLEQCYPGFTSRMLLRQASQAPANAATAATDCTIPDAASANSAATSVYVRPAPSDSRYPSYVRARTRPWADDFVRSIAHGAGFAAVHTIVHVQPGDVLAWEYELDDDKQSVTGHVMLVATTPVLVSPADARPPTVRDTLQYECHVIDSSQFPHSGDDTRLASGVKCTGLGTGRVRLYAHVSSGAILGFAKCLDAPRANKFYSFRGARLVADEQWANDCDASGRVKSRIGLVGRPCET
jgi:hypothetical protein